jgi:hypothetical protein
MYEISVVEIKPVERSNLKAFVTVEVNGIVIKDCRLVQQPGQAAWLSGPQVSYEVSGEKEKSGRALWSFPRS